MEDGKKYNAKMYKMTPIAIGGRKGVGIVALPLLLIRFRQDDLLAHISFSTNVLFIIPFIETLC